MLFFLCIPFVLLKTMNLGSLQVRGLISGVFDIAYRDIRTSKADKKKAESWFIEVEAELFELKNSSRRRNPD